MRVRKYGKESIIQVSTLPQRNLSVSHHLLSGCLGGVGWADVLFLGCVVTEKGVAERKEGESAIDVSQVC